MTGENAVTNYVKLQHCMFDELLNEMGPVIKKRDDQLRRAPATKL